VSKLIYLSVLIPILANLVAFSTISLVPIPNAFAFDTHMTLHNLQNQVGDEGPAELSIVGASKCTAQPNSNCEPGADYVWYTVNICVTSCGNDAIWQTTMHGVYGSCMYMFSLLMAQFHPNSKLRIIVWQLKKQA
jgi:hypothetical protein